MISILKHISQHQILTRFIRLHIGLVVLGKGMKDVAGQCRSYYWLSKYNVGLWMITHGILDEHDIEISVQPGTCMCGWVCEIWHVTPFFFCDLCFWHPIAYYFSSPPKLLVVCWNWLLHTASDEGKEYMVNLVNQLLELHLKWVWCAVSLRFGTSHHHRVQTFLVVSCVLLFCSISSLPSDQHSCYCSGHPSSMLQVFAILTSRCQLTLTR